MGRNPFKFKMGRSTLKKRRPVKEKWKLSDVMPDSVKVEVGGPPPLPKGSAEWKPKKKRLRA